jgi:hypothetical protein
MTGKSCKPSERRVSWGLQGPMGNPGTQGATGNVGPTGQQGPKGDTGAPPPPDPLHIVGAPGNPPFLTQWHNDGLHGEASFFRDSGNVVPRGRRLRIANGTVPGDAG